METVQRFVNAVAECVRFYGMEEKAKLRNWPRVEDVISQLDGFGDDHFPLPLHLSFTSNLMTLHSNSSSNNNSNFGQEVQY